MNDALIYTLTYKRVSSGGRQWGSKLRRTLDLMESDLLEFDCTSIETFSVFTASRNKPILKQI